MARKKSTDISIAKPVTLDEESKNIVDDVIKEKDPDKIKDLIDLFNLNQSKKNLARTDTCNKLLDKVVEEAFNRVSNGSMLLTDKELLEYANSISALMTKFNVDPENLIVPTIRNNTQVNINMFELNRDSREKVTDAVKAILAKASSGEYIDIVDSEEQI